MTILETLQTIPCVQVIYEDAEKIFCSVRITIARIEKINSGSMMFDHPRYYTFGQLVIFTDKDIAQDQSGALFFKAETPDAVKEIIYNLADYIQPEKTAPDDCIIIDQGE